MGLDTDMILEAVPAPPSKSRNAHQAINRTSRHYAGVLGSIATYFANKSLENDQFDRADAHSAAVALRTAGRSDQEPFRKRDQQDRSSSASALAMGCDGAPRVGGSFDKEDP